MPLCKTVTVACEAEIHIACYTVVVCQLVHLQTPAHDTILPTIVYIQAQACAELEQMT